MRFDTGSTRTRLLAMALAIGAAACAKTDDAATTDSAAGTVDSAAVANPVTGFRVSDVEIGKSVNEDKTIKDNTDDFGVRDTIYAAVKTEGTATGATLMARWTFQDGQNTQVVEEQSQTLNATGDMITSFRLTKATAWPKGNYKLAILLNGTEVETEDFEVK